MGDLIHVDYCLCGFSTDGRVHMWDVRRATGSLFTLDQYNGDKSKASSEAGRFSQYRCSSLCILHCVFMISIIKGATGKIFRCYRFCCRKVGTQEQMNDGMAVDLSQGMWH